MSRVQVDLATVDQDEAASLVAHHLAMAGAMFQALPEGNEAEAMRHAIDQQFQGFNMEAEAAHRFCDILVARYEALKDDD
jgi:hypothetical protein